MRSDRRPMSNSFRPRPLMIGLLVAALAAIAVTIGLAVISTATTSKRANKEATEAVLLAQMQNALQQVAVIATDWSNGAGIDLADPRLGEANSVFGASVTELQTMAMPMSGSCLPRLQQNSMRNSVRLRAQPLPVEVNCPESQPLWPRPRLPPLWWPTRRERL